MNVGEKEKLGNIELFLIRQFYLDIHHVFFFLYLFSNLKISHKVEKETRNEKEGRSSLIRRGSESINLFESRFLRQILPGIKKQIENLNPRARARLLAFSIISIPMIPIVSCQCTERKLFFNYRF